MRIGTGFDTHRLVDDRPLIIGGVNIPYEKGLLGHSDADVLLHAVMDAVLGALGMGDIGRHFPDTDPQYKGADSRVLLRECVKRVNAAGWGIVNVDASIIAQAPKLAPHMESIRASVAETLGVGLGCVNIKAKTNEGMDAVGRKEAIEVHAVALLESL
jgi:2-C-methyl-D-erythritol 2,4-cyclodiphosphate synthase